MEKLSSKILLVLAMIVLLITTIACNKDESVLLSETASSSDKSALEKIVNEDESIESFDLNYNEEEIMSFVLGKTAEEIFPVKVGQKMTMINKTLDVVFEGDTAYGKVEKTFEGILFIIASSDSLNGNIDSLDLNVYEKPFSTTIQRNVIFVKIDNSDNPDDNWRLSSISLSVGGTITENISIEQVSIYMPDGEIISIEEPLDYYLSRGPSFKRKVPAFSKYQSVGVEIVVKSIYPEQDFVTLTYGAVKLRKKLRAKRKFVYVEGSETFDGTYYYRTYKGDWVIHQHRGFRHAVINVFPWGVLKESEAPVESKSWGVPYVVN